MIAHGSTKNSNLVGRYLSMIGGVATSSYSKSSHDRLAMAVDLKKRKRGPVSYKEPSSDEDFSEDSNDTRHSRRKRTGEPQRRSARHRTPTSTEPAQTQSAPTPQVRTKTASRPSPNQVLRSRGRARQNIYYGEDSSSDNYEGSDSDTVLSPRKRVSTGNGRDTSSKRGKGAVKRSPKTTFKTGGLGTPLRRRDAPQPSEPKNPCSIPSDGKIPPWETLPYHVLLQIFVYAAYPLHDENMSPSPSIAWLAQTARICTNFTKPALTALYRNPPIFALRNNRKKLVQHLVSPPSDAHEDYGVMVKRLELDITKMSKLTNPTDSPADLLALVSSLKTLREVDIFDPYDKPPYRARAKNGRRWSYPDDLFEALERSQLRLRSWRWNGVNLQRDYHWMKTIHSQNSFQSLRELTLTNHFTRPPTKTDEDEVITPSLEEILGTALAALPNLKSLTFETCSIVNDVLLSSLPKDLRSLVITNCRDLTSPPLRSFLSTHGNHLEELVLNHNQSLDLSFLVDLKQFCPRLEVLRIDMNYYSSLFLTSDNEPLYDALILESEIPSWPSSLQVIDLEYLRNWSPDAAIAFFTSLIDASGELLALREIVLTAMVDVDWRLRAKFRKDWTARFQQVFARRPLPPDQNLASLRAFREAGVSQVTTPNLEPGTPLCLPETQASSAQLTSDDDTPLRRQSPRDGDEKWDTKRLRSRATTKEVSPSDDELGFDDSADATQGLCHTVLFRIDNSRPQEQIYHEQDFLDDEVSGDEDWNGNNDAVDDGGGYAW